MKDSKVITTERTAERILVSDIFGRDGQKAQRPDHGFWEEKDAVSRSITAAMCWSLAVVPRVRRRRRQRPVKARM